MSSNNKNGLWSFYEDREVFNNEITSCGARKLWILSFYIFLLFVFTNNNSKILDSIFVCIKLRLYEELWGAICLHFRWNVNRGSRRESKYTFVPSQSLKIATFKPQIQFISIYSKIVCRAQKTHSGAIIMWLPSWIFFCFCISSWIWNLNNFRIYYVLLNWRSIPSWLTF